jgi:hypothetical protein
MDLEQIIAAGNALARSLGHSHHCPKVSPAIPCTCKSSLDQAKALDDWQHLVAELANAHFSKQVVLFPRT